MAYAVLPPDINADLRSCASTNCIALHRYHMWDTVNSLCKGTRCKDNLDVRTAPLVTNRGILTAAVPLSKDNLM